MEMEKDNHSQHIESASQVDAWAEFPLLLLLLLLLILQDCQGGAETSSF
jgi:hypothetical protein